MKRSEEREQNIRRVIHTAQTLFIADGIAATPISRIAEAAGLTPTSLYRYFRSDVNNVFWKYYDKEIPVPALKALREGVADGSIRPDVNIYAVYQCLLNAYTGTTIYENLSFGVSPVDVVQFTGELLVSYIKNEPDASVLAGKREKASDM